MPHRSHKKKATPRKRQNIVDEDGWTRVTSKPPIVPHQYDTEDDMRPMTKEQVEITWKPLAPASDASVEELLGKYFTTEEAWKKTESYECLTQLLWARLIQWDDRIDKCVLLGSGSFSGLGQGWIDRSHVALFQLAVFKSIVDFINAHTRDRPQAIAQEPQYNDLDERLLIALGVVRKDHPDGINALTKHSFAYCPGAEQYVSILTLVAAPAFILGSNLTRLSELKGCLHSRTPELAFPVYENLKNQRYGTWLSSTNLDDLKKLVGHVTFYGDVNYLREIVEARCRDEPYVRAIQDNLSGLEAALIPDVDARDYPFHEQWLYMRKHTDEGEEKRNEQQSRNGTVNFGISRAPPSGMNTQQLNEWLDGVEEEREPLEHPAST